MGLDAAAVAGGGGGGANLLLVELLIDALSTHQNHRAMGVYLARAHAVESYRYSTSPASADPIIWSTNGATWGVHNAKAEENEMTETAILGVMSTLKQLLELLPEIPFAPPADAEDRTSVRRTIEYFLHNRLGNTAYQGNVIKRMIAVMQTNSFYTDRGEQSLEEFDAMMDGNDNLLGFRNGVMDLSPLRSSVPPGARFYPVGTVPVQFMVSMKVPGDYPGGLPWVTVEPGGEDVLQPDEDTIESFRLQKEAVAAKFATLYPDSTMRNNAKLVYGCVLFGGNANFKNVFQMLGRPNGGKSSVQRFFSLVLGSDYVATAVQKSLFFDRPGSLAWDEAPDKPTPQLWNARKMRIAFVNELKEACTPNDQLKALTGGDPIPVRALNKMPITVEIKAKIFVLSNVPITIPTGDEAWDPVDPKDGRARCSLGHDAKFTDDPSAVNAADHVFLKEPKEVLDKFYRDNWVGAMFFLLEGAKAFAEAGFALPLTPAGTAVAALLKSAGTSAAFEHFIDANYFSTANRQGTPDFEKYKERAVISIQEIINHYQHEETIKNYPKKDAKAVLIRKGHFVGSAHANRSGPLDGQVQKNKFFKGIRSGGVMLCRHDADAQTNDGGTPPPTRPVDEEEARLIDMSLAATAFAGGQGGEEEGPSSPLTASGNRSPRPPRGPRVESGSSEPAPPAKRPRMLTLEGY